MIIHDSQKMIGKKVEMYSLPYSSIHMWSTENAAGMFDMNAEVELWIKVGHIKVDIRRFDRLIAEAVL